MIAGEDGWLLVVVPLIDNVEHLLLKPVVLTVPFQDFRAKVINEQEVNFTDSLDDTLGIGVVVPC
jgi:hypothetical protein